MTHITVTDYFAQQIGVDPGDVDLDASAAAMPIDSVCGRDCRVAIDAANALLGQIAMAYGESGMRWEHARAWVSETTADVCNTFICG